MTYEKYLQSVSESQKTLLLSEDTSMVKKYAWFPRKCILTKKYIWLRSYVLATHTSTRMIKHGNIYSFGDMTVRLPVDKHALLVYKLTL